MLPIWRYQFVKYVTLSYLSDSDVLIRLACVSKPVQQSLARYIIKQYIKQSNLSDCKQYIVENLIVQEQYTYRVVHPSRKLQIVSSLDGVSQTIKRLTFTNEFNTFIRPNFFSQSNIQTITFGVCFNHSILPECLPTSLQSLRFGDAFNQPILPGTLPSSLTRLFLGNSFDQPIDVRILPSNLQDIHFGHSFNQPIIDGTFPSSLKMLCFGSSFTQKFPLSILCPNLTHLTLESETQLVNLRPLPTYLEKLILRSCLSKGVINLSDTLLTELTLYTTSLGTLQRLPKTLKKFECRQVWPGKQDKICFPDSLVELKLLICNTDFDIPSSVTNLTLGSGFNQVLTRTTFPKCLRRLKFVSGYTQPIQRGVFPNGLTRLTFGDEFNQSLVYNQFPDSLTRLKFGSCFNQMLNKCILGESLTHLTLGRQYSQIISSKLLPSNLTHLTFYACNYNVKAQSMMIPDNLIELVTCKCFQHPISMLIKLTRMSCLCTLER